MRLAHSLLKVVVLFFSTPGMKNLPLILAAILIGLIVAFPSHAA